MAETQVNLLKLFQGAAKALASNKDVLNQADPHNHDHGDNMVQVFDTVAQAMKEKKGAAPSEQLAYASAKAGQPSTTRAACPRQLSNSRGRR